MTDDDRSAFAQLCAMLAETFGEVISPVRAAAYWEALADLPFDRVRQGALRCLRTCTFFPKPAEIRDAVGKREPLRVVPDVRATRRLLDSYAEPAVPAALDPLICSIGRRIP